MMKYPRTPHVRGSAIQRGDKDLDSVPFDNIKDKFLIIEEKLDGANCGISFSSEQLTLQSRGGTLGGSDHPQFDLFKAWATSCQGDLHAVLGDRYIMFGEWMFSKHTVFYDALPHYFLEFDIFDKESMSFLGTKTRHSMLEGTGVVHVPVLYTGEVNSLEDLVAFVQTSRFKTPKMLDNLESASSGTGIPFEDVKKQSDETMLGEGLYIKDESSGVVDGRYKWVRPDFLQTIKDSGSHWMGRRTIQNQLAPGIEIW